MLSSLYQTYSYQNLLNNLIFYGLPPLHELNDDPRLFSSTYQCQYKRNYDALKLEFKEKISQNISFVALRKFYLTRHENIE